MNHVVEEPLARRGRVIESHAHPKELSVLRLQRGDRIKVGRQDQEWPSFYWCMNDRGEGGWVPAGYFRQTGKLATMLRDYDTLELEADLGTEVEIVSTIGGWHRARTHDGEGWIPAVKVSLRASELP